MSEDNFNIYKELEYIKYNDLSKIGKNIHVLFNNISIDGFLHRSKMKVNLNFLERRKNDDKITSSIFYENIDNENDEIPQKINIENIRNWNKKYKIKSNLLNYLQKENNKIPPCAYYNPNYNSISKHIPIVKLKPIKYKSQGKLIKNNLLKRNLSCPKINSTFNLEKSFEKEQNDRLNISNNNNEQKFPIKKIKKILNNSIENINVNSFDKYSERKNLFIKKLYVKTKLEPKKKIQSRFFKKMKSRDKNSEFNKKINSYIDYKPNYNSINFNENKSIQNEKNEELKRKEYLMKKLWSNFKTSNKYLNVPTLNKNK